jgi:hypothetical protein
LGTWSRRQGPGSYSKETIETLEIRIADWIARQ